MRVKLNLVTVRAGHNRDGIDPGTLLNKEAILAGETLVSSDKCFFDISAWDDEDEPYPRVPPSSIEWVAYVNGSPVGSFFGSTDSEQKIGPWKLGGQGIRKLEDSNGYAVILQNAGNPGTVAGGLQAILDGNPSNIIWFPRMD